MLVWEARALLHPPPMPAGCGAGPSPPRHPPRAWGFAVRHAAGNYPKEISSCSSLPCKPPQTSPFPAPAVAGGSLGSQGFKEGVVVATEVRRGPAPPEHSPCLPVSLAEGTAGAGGRPRVPAPGNGAGRKGFFFPTETAAVELVSVAQDGPPTAGLHPKMWGNAWHPGTGWDPQDRGEADPSSPQSRAQPWRGGRCGTVTMLGAQGQGTLGVVPGHLPPARAQEPSWARGQA